MTHATDTVACAAPRPVPPARLTGLQAQARIPSAWGDLIGAASADGLVGLWFVDGQRDHPGLLDAPQDPTHPDLAAAAEALRRHAAGEDPRARELRYDLRGTPFQVGVWRALLALDPGETATYGELARRLGRPKAVRAVGAAVGRNPVSVLIPCHRVLGADGRLTGYSGGLERKVGLLRHEGLLLD